MSSKGWRTLMNDEWASCALHNLPFFMGKKVVAEKAMTISITGYQESAADWNYFDFKEKLSWIKDVGVG